MFAARMHEMVLTFSTRPREGGPLIRTPRYAFPSVRVSVLHLRFLLSMVCVAARAVDYNITVFLTGSNC